MENPIKAGSRAWSVDRVRPWLYLSIPLSLGMGYWLAGDGHEPASLHLTLDRPGAIQKAVEVLSGMGVTVSPAGATVEPEGQRSALYWASRRIARGDAVPDSLVLCRVKVRFGQPGSDSGRSGGAEVTLDSQGRYIGFDLPRTSRPIDVSDAARRIVEQFPGATLTGKAGSFEVVDARVPDLKQRLSVSSNSAELHTTAPETSSAKRWGDIQRAFNEVAKLILIVSTIYALRLFVRRRREGEVPVGRALLLLGFMTLLGAVSFALDSDQMAARAGSLGLSDLPLTFVLALAGAGLYALAGALLGGAYAATEGELREGYPGKLLALDSILSGRILTQAAGRAILDGVAIGSLCFVIAMIFHRLTGQWLGTMALKHLEHFWSRWPTVRHLASIPLNSSWGEVAGLMIPLAFFHRHQRWSRFAWVTVATIGFIVNTGLNGFSMMSAGTVAVSLLWVIAMITGFQASGIAGGIVAAGSFQFLSQSAGMSVLHHSSHVVMGLIAVALVLVPFLYAAWKGDVVTDEDVQPQYAARITQRMVLRGKMEAARAAQTRLMPAELPRIPGLELSAHCFPAGLAGGDFYDFFPIEGGRHAILLRSGGGPGLPSALAIALVKGYLECGLPGVRNPTEAIQRFLAEFGHLADSNVPGSGGVLMFVDPANGRVEAARRGRFPMLWRLSAADVQPVEFARNGRIESTEFHLQPSETLFLHTRGLTALLEDHSLEGHRRWLKQGAKDLDQIGPGVLDAALFARLWGKKKLGPPMDLPTDLTTLVMRRERA